MVFILSHWLRKTGIAIWGKSIMAKSYFPILGKSFMMNYNPQFKEYTNIKQNVRFSHIGLGIKK